ncbi:ectoine/hydroxyectoine ABC transporter substrate-binding protein EhuB [Mesorhizobium loti]|uniref:Probable ABC transporter solute-binding protein n=1 Tax=Rhizobium loti TaxID=381 RepID=M5ALQ0_RHILI|nr:MULTISPECIES: ectoine/hydroxyectoine ABC transporter substrate-binding protein EhuB [Mesorhizobium]ANN60887.1 ectoine/hydroxyectoine ABC transporter substrate-binding protein EhuB [Mesorhizobium loti NZP2037]OBP78137.1 ectoine/hydroxyectoine ABC transporter substrate-binding protein EhuB [Mesorhizobium loti]OBP92853.1 ectoine/hydroxyectoine ABC transporter substrate-binding protein EhuB [Mesorhizobium loti]OBQ66526.1 ectoine/hydroxyectoine ABC transporter substrate-binding protein EhuB [Meso
MVKWKLDKCSKTAILKRFAALGIAAMTISSFAGSASAESLLDKIKNGETIRLGFTNEPPSAYPGANNEPLGLVNAMTLDVLKKMGTTKIEPVVTDWGSLVPGLQAGRFDIITGGMWIKPERCRNVLFSEPIASSNDVIVVSKGNPEALHSLKDVHDKGLTLAIMTGTTAVEEAKKLGFADDKIMQVAGPPEVVQAVKAGRAAAGNLYSLNATTLAENDTSIEVADPYTPPGPSEHPAIAFSLSEQAAVDAFNTVLKDYIGSDEMMAAVGKYGYTKRDLPDDKKTADLCKG